MKIILSLFLLCNLAHADWRWEQRTIGVDALALKAARTWGRAAHLKIVKGSDVTVEYAELGEKYGATWWEVDSDTIVRAHILLNPNMPATERYAVLLHEMGHALGLEHTNDIGDVMYLWIMGRTRLSAGDRAAIRALYPRG